MTDERSRGYSLQEHVVEAERDVIRESNKIETENRELRIRVDDLEKALIDIREILDSTTEYRCIEDAAFDRLEDTISDALGDK